MTAAAVGTAITLVVDRLTPEAARRIVALFDRERGAPLAAGQIIDLQSALDVLPHGNDYALLIGVWNYLAADARDAWMAEGRAHIHRATAPANAATVARPGSAAAVTRERRGRVVLHAPAAFGRARGTR
jgi:hypothetical protein